MLGRPLSCARDYLAEIGYMPSEALFYPGMRVEEVIAYSAKLRRKNCAAEAAALCRRLELDPRKRVEALSLGNRKKLSIVCAMQHRPRLYILDEPTSGLDPLMQRTFFELLRERSGEGATVFLFSHVLSEVQHNCAQAAIIREGRLAAVDSIERLARTEAKRVALRGVSALPAGLEGQDVRADAEGVSFLYCGETPALLTALSRLPLTDVSISEPELDEVFRHYYETEGTP